MNSGIREILINVIGSIVATIVITIVIYVISVNVAIAVASLVVILIVTLASSITYYYIKRYYFVCKTLGIESRSEKKKENWEKSFLESKNIRILLCRGGAVLGTDTDPLYLTLTELPKKWNGKIRVLLLNPESSYIVDRAKELEADVETIKNQCRMVMDNIRRLKENYGIDIKGAYYNTKPFLRYTLFDGFGFFSYPAWGEKYKPFPYQFRIKRGKTTLYGALSVHFEQLWKISEKVVE